MIERAIQQLRQMITRGILTGITSNPVRPLAALTALFDESKTNVELFHPYGRSAIPVKGEVILLQVLGSRSHLIAICADDGDLRISDLGSGEFGDRDQNGQQIVFRADRIEVTTPLKLVANVTGDVDLTVGGNVNLTVTGKVTAQAGEFDLTGNLNVTGNISATGTVSDSVRSMAADRAKYDSHTHGGVQTGGGTTATPSPTE